MVLSKHDPPRLGMAKDEGCASGLTSLALGGERVKLIPRPYSLITHSPLRESE
jgi:hypothetical protein